ncbi:Crp/Fnr family transcriptional regulator [Methylobacterium variabile]|jgi:CRP/FNR family transcriptional regulator|uniref:Crp/Fnr family transcriptional regulator n=1 Tax=Methylobacterium variabile TaxID=298794 RepID=A0A0J6T7P5_9HYPH|nr:MULTISPECIES: Crp/Fnr family transcriptional regulator [Methylobacterium]KMO41573.1 Crp/Fnr family transcriptional regulator [Methylobacterium variabile]UHC20313.1 Crp/Fnr family transcriptional regulator [Methylobacterium currus]
MNNLCAGCAVRDQALCGSLSDEELTALNSVGRRRHVSAGTTVMWSGAENLLCGNLLDGILKMAAAASDGREQIVGLLYAADFFGQPYADEVDFTITALTDAELCTFPRGAFEHVLEHHVRLENLLLQRTLKALNEARGRMLTLARMSATEKVTSLLLEMAARAGPCGCSASHGGPVTFDLPLTRGQMADVLGITIETVSRQLTRLKGAGLIALSGSRTVAIADLGALKTQISAA